MALGSVWRPPTEEKFLQEEGPKEEKNCPYPLRKDIKNNDRIFFKIYKVLLFLK